MIKSYADQLLDGLYKFKKKLIGVSVPVSSHDRCNGVDIKFVRPHMQEIMSGVFSEHLYNKCSDWAWVKKTEVGMVYKIVINPVERMLPTYYGIVSFLGVTSPQLVERYNKYAEKPLNSDHAILQIKLSSIFPRQEAYFDRFFDLKGYEDISVLDDDIKKTSSIILRGIKKITDELCEPSDLISIYENKSYPWGGSPHPYFYVKLDQVK